MSVNEKMTAIADAIRAKIGSADTLNLDAMASAIAAISTGVDTSDATAYADAILEGLTAYVNGGKVTGTIPSQDAVTITPGTANKTAIAAGTYAKGAVTVKGDSNLKAANIASGVSIFGVNGTFKGDDSGAKKILYTPSERIQKITITHGLGRTPTYVAAFATEISSSLHGSYKFTITMAYSTETSRGAVFGYGSSTSNPSYAGVTQQAVSCNSTSVTINISGYYFHAVPYTIFVY